MEADQKTTTGLAGYLRERGIDTVFMVGIATDFCVAWTAMDACKLGFKSLCDCRCHQGHRPESVRCNMPGRICSLQGVKRIYVKDIVQRICPEGLDLR